MSHRHVSRQQDREVRMADPSPTLAPHLNGAPAPVVAVNGAHHSHHASPSVAHAVAVNGSAVPLSLTQKLTRANEDIWMLVGRVAEQMGELDLALSAYESVLRHNPESLQGLSQVASIARIKENYPKAIEYFQRVVNHDERNGEIWSALGHCYLMQDDLQKAYAAYQQALYNLPNPKEDPKLWYGIGILYDRYGSLDHAEEAFSSVLRMDKELDFDKANEILFRLGIIYKQQCKYTDSLNCFHQILRNPPSPLAHADIWFQIGHVHEQQKDFVQAKEAYERVVQDNPTHAKVLQQLGWLYHQDGSSFQNQDEAIHYLTKSLEADSSDAQSWYLLGRAFMAGQKYNKAYEAYQQAVYRDSRNPTFWCSIGVLYFQINQFRDALDAYSRAIRINPYISEVWFDLGSLYESCNNQISDAIDAYARASELDPSNQIITQRLQLLKNAQINGTRVGAAPGPQDVHPTAYANVVPPGPGGMSGMQLMLQPPGVTPRPAALRTESRGPGNEMALPPPSQMTANARSGSPPFRGGPPPPVVLDDRHPPSHTPLAPMELDRGGGPLRDGGRSLLNRDSVPPQQIRSANGHIDPFYTRPAGARPSRSSSPAAPAPAPIVAVRGRSPESWHQRPPNGSPVMSNRQFATPQREYDSSPMDNVRSWSRNQAAQQQDIVRGPEPPRREPSPPMSERQRSVSRSSARVSRRYLPPGMEEGRMPGYERERERTTRYDPRMDLGNERDAMEADRRANYERSPESMRGRGVAQAAGSSRKPSPGSPHAPTAMKRGAPSGDQIAGPSKRKRRSGKSSGSDTPKAAPEGWSEKSRAGARSPAMMSSSGNSSSRSVQPSPTASTGMVRPPSRIVDEDYDEPGASAADALIGLASAGSGSYRQAEPAPKSNSPTVSTGSRHSDTARAPSHRNSVSSQRSPLSPPAPPPPTLKRPPSHGDSEGSEPKRPRMDSRARRPSSPGRRSPAPSSRPSPIPFRTQPASRSPDTHEPYQASPSLPAVLPPHPRPIGNGGGGQGSSPKIALPPIATLQSPKSPQEEREDRMQVDRSRSGTPRRRSPNTRPSPPKVEKD
ncbi:hypothetical protein EV715DRAFT_257907 [Schizophyllum commune]